MRVKCVLCDKIENINSDTLQAKRLRNRPIHTYMCDPCNERIADKTNNRIATGNFKLYRSKVTKDDW
ncbi:YlaI family protein [Mesobacillus selenatarsenatis]|uniref:YlaI family protein n=1 Tax=Mesobacillus selenatarsenatis TaxID=388741 RepID=UPI0005AA41FB|nr:YlaI family protein [Mesobacillus selenatarsenatis]